MLLSTELHVLVLCQSNAHQAVLVQVQVNTIEYSTSTCTQISLPRWTRSRLPPIGPPCSCVDLTLRQTGAPNGGSWRLNSPTSLLEGESYILIYAT